MNRAEGARTPATIVAELAAVTGERIGKSNLSRYAAFVREHPEQPDRLGEIVDLLREIRDRLPGG